MTPSTANGTKVAGPRTVPAARPSGLTTAERVTALNVGPARTATAGRHRPAATDAHAPDDARAIALEKRRLEHLQRSLLANISHELRTPLTSILGFAKTLQTRGAGSFTDEQLDHIIDRIAAGAERLHRIVDDVADVDRIDRADVAPRLHDTDLTVVAASVCRSVDVTTHDLTLAFEPARVHADPDLIRRATDHLVRNALQHTPPGTTVRVRTRCDASHALLEVEDDGPGIEPGLRAVIFEPFRQGHAAATAASPGTGIGLAFVHRVARLHQGRVRIETPCDGGARFVLELPALTGAPRA